MPEFNWQDVDDALFAANTLGGVAERLIERGGPLVLVAGPMAEIAERQRDLAERIEKTLPPREPSREKEDG